VTGTRRDRSYLIGLLVGSSLGIVLSAVILAFLLHNGVTVRLEAQTLAQSLALQAEERLLFHMPSLLGEARKRVPDLVRPELKRRLEAAKIEFYGVSISVPPESLGGLENYLVGLVEQTVGKLLDGFFDDFRAGGSRAPLEAALAEVLCTELGGKVLNVTLFSLWSVPVTLVVE
jgi:hypothetical protein